MGKVLKYDVLCYDLYFSMNVWLFAVGALLLIMTAVTRLFNTLGKIGLGIAVAGGAANTALYNGMMCIGH